MEGADEIVLNGLMAIAKDYKVVAYVRIGVAEVLGELGFVDEILLKGLLSIVDNEKLDVYVRYDAVQILKKLLG